MVTTASRRADILPADLSRFVGRRAEVAATKRLLTESRLVTLTGTGGVGKSRLALHVARLVRAAFRDGVYLVSLADLTRPELVASTVMAAMNDGPRQAGREELVELVSSRHLLLVLDNCERVTAAAAELATELLRRCPDLRILATSRERLRVDGEATYPVPPLSVPEAGRRLSAHEMTQYDAVVLFLDRAASLNPSTTLTEEEQEAVAALCRSLDGLPLAIELVAGRTGALPLKTLLQRRDNLLHLLAPGTRSAPVRHQTLRATVDYSYELCSESARKLWERMAVFAGGSNLDAIPAVCSGPTLPTEDLENALAELVDKSIVTFDGRRYQMLETLRQYGDERLRASPDERTVRRAHRDHFAAGLGVAADPGQALAELANLRAALDFCLSEPHEVPAGLRMAASLWEFWIGCGLQREGRHWLNDLLAAHPSGSPDRAAALWVSGYLAVLDGDLEEGLGRADECRVLSAELPDPESHAHAWFVRAQAELVLENVDDALADMETAVRLEREIPGDTRLLVTSLTALGAALAYVGDADRAKQMLDEAHVLCQRYHFAVQEVWCVLLRGFAALQVDQIQEAERCLKEALTLNGAADVHATSFGLEYLAWAAMARGDASRAAQLMGASLGLSEPSGPHLSGFRGLQDRHEDLVRRARDELGVRAFDTAFDAGHQMDAERATAFALERSSSTPQDVGAAEKLPLTRREREVSRLVAAGLSNKEIASKLVISQRTAEGHIENILRKLGFTSRAQVAALIATDDLSSR